MNKVLTIINESQFADTLAKINRKAKRLGCGLATYRVLSKQQQARNVYVLDRDDPRREARFDRAETVETTTVEVVCPDEPVRLNGWQFMARLTPVECVAGNVVAGPGANECPQRYLTQPICCEHCNAVRRRNDTFALRHDAGAWKQVGRTCLVDFIGDRSADKAADYFAFISERLEVLNGYEGAEERMWGGRGEATYDLVAVIAAGLILSPNGYVGKAKAAERGVDSTVELVRWNYREAFGKITEAHREQAEAIIADALESIPAGSPDAYLHNCRTIATAGYCTGKTMGLGVSLIAGYQFRKARREEQTGPESNFVGVVGERITVTGTIYKVLTFDGQYGSTNKCLIRDASGNVLTANNVGKEGDIVTIKATVKDHVVYRDTRQTVLARPRVA